jgi:hypothetical protein
MKRIALLVYISLTLLMLSCSNDNGPITNDNETTMPVIDSLFSDKTEIMYGGTESTVLTCKASGGNLKYVWQVDLGDIIPINNDKLKVSFTGSACCVGIKIISCTVSNNKGSVTGIVKVKILENSFQPEVISIETDKPEINSAAGESANLICYAVGGNLKYEWQSDCGKITVDEDESWKISYKPSTNCVGTQNITCTVTNEKGMAWSTYQIEVK